ncbi:MAG: phosphoribosyltransferase family protein [Planctomycetota bacterium]|nr:phosphoribosyltransferase family protein [Planctomycetota bacterium]
MQSQSIRPQSPESKRPKRWYRPFVDLVYPRICVLCAKPIVDLDLESLCVHCESQITPTTVSCLRCSAPLPGAGFTKSDATKKKCYYCERRKWAFRKAYCYTAYSGAAARVARKIKQPSCEPLAIELGNRVGLWLRTLEHFDAKQYDFVVPIPQHWIRRVMVRYNQAEVLAENVARELEIPVRRNWLYRTRLTDKQGTKTIVERRTSVTNSFGCKRAGELKSAKILIVDDIVTSGATAHEAAAALRKSGAAQVDIAAFARGVGSFNQKIATH